MHRLRRHPRRLTVIALIVALVVVVVIALASGPGRFIDAWSHLRPHWLLVAIIAEVVAYPAYAVAYRELVRFNDGPRLRLPLLARVVVAGFAPYAPAGGFGLDRRALHVVGGDKHQATIRVVGLGALEWALLAPATWVCAVLLLISGNPAPMKSLLWPWVLGVPPGFALGCWLARPGQRERLGDGRIAGGLKRVLRGVDMLFQLAEVFPRYAFTWIGMAMYWACDIAAFYAACRFVSLRLDLGEIVVAYATGYALTRRSMPFAGAGVTELLMTLALHWVGEPIGPALAAVIVYRVFNLVLPAGPALLVQPGLAPLLRSDGTDAAGEGRSEPGVAVGGAG